MLRVFFRRLLFVLGTAWASPVTAAFLALVVLPAWLFGWVKYLGFRGLAWAWVVTASAPAKFCSLLGATGAVAGSAMVLQANPDGSQAGTRLLLHKMEHVKQCMVFGALFPFVYALVHGICAATPALNARFDHPMEVAARRAAGQIVDPWGLALRVKSSLRQGATKVP